jgi:hypothetical protein
MSPVIRIPEHIYKRLESKAEGFDTPASVIERLLNFYDEGNTVKEEAASRETEATPQITTTEQADFEKLSPRKQGARRREVFLNLLKGKGIYLEQISEVVFCNGKGKSIGIASAKENPTKADNWFLGLPPENYQTVVLLCGNSKNPECISIILSPFFYEKVRGSLSVDQKGQLKFNVEKNQKRFFLKTANGKHWDVSSSVGNFQNLTFAAQKKAAEESEIPFKKKSKLEPVSNPTAKKEASNFIHNLYFESGLSIRLRQIYGVLYFMKKGCDFPEAAHLTLNIFPEVKDYQTISDKCARRFAGSVDVFIHWFKAGRILKELNAKFSLSDHDYSVFEKLLTN